MSTTTTPMPYFLRHGGGPWPWLTAPGHDAWERLAERGSHRTSRHVGATAEGAVAEP